MDRFVKLVEEKWNPKMVDRVSGWLDELEKAKEKHSSGRRPFNQWKPFKVYSSVDMARKANPVFSLRFNGQAVAEVRTINGQVSLVFSKGQLRTNAERFGYHGEEKPVAWNGDKAKAFRAHFSKLAEDHPTTIIEHSYETRIIFEMARNDSGKFGGKFRGIQPVFLRGSPFQMPVPISGKGEPTLGHIDILARRHSSTIAVWELKKPEAKQTSTAIKESLIYSATLQKLLRSSIGERLYNFWGFSKLPKKLKIEAVVVLSSKDEADYERTIKKYKTANIEIGNDLIVPCCAFYDEDLNMDFRKLNP